MVIAHLKLVAERQNIILHLVRVVTINQVVLVNLVLLYVLMKAHAKLKLFIILLVSVTPNVVTLMISGAVNMAVLYQ